MKRSSRRRVVVLACAIIYMLMVAADLSWYQCPHHRAFVMALALATHGPRQPTFQGRQGKTACDDPGMGPCTCVGACDGRVIAYAPPPQALAPQAPPTVRIGSRPSSSRAAPRRSTNRYLRPPALAPPALG